MDCSINNITAPRELQSLLAYGESLKRKINKYNLRYGKDYDSYLGVHAVLH